MNGSVRSPRAFGVHLVSTGGFANGCIVCLASLEFGGVDLLQGKHYSYGVYQHFSFC